jgi:hypothetical protein
LLRKGVQAPNFRKLTSVGLKLAASGQPSVRGVRAILRHFASAGATATATAKANASATAATATANTIASVAGGGGGGVGVGGVVDPAATRLLWINLRAEPVVYINSRGTLTRV